MIFVPADFALHARLEMDIDASCRVVRQCNDAFIYGKSFEGSSGSVVEAVWIVKRYLEGVRADGKPIRELEMPDSLLCTPEGMRRAMPFVLSVESMRGWSRRVSPR